MFWTILFWSLAVLSILGVMFLHFCYPRVRLGWFVALALIVSGLVGGITYLGFCCSP